MVRRRERREIRAPGRPMPYDDGLPEGQYDSEHHAQHRDGTDTPDSGGTTVRTGGGEVDAGEAGDGAARASEAGFRDPDFRRPRGGGPRNRNPALR